MRNFVKNLVLMKVLVLTSFVGYSQTIISIANGNNVIKSGQTIPWDQSYYIVEDPVTIEQGGTLVIDPTTNSNPILIEFDPGTFIDVEGIIQAIGTQGYNIVFTESTSGNGWQGIRIDNNSNTNIFKYCTFEKVLKQFVSCSGGLDFTHAGTVYMYSSNNTSFTNCVFRDNLVCYAGGGIFANESTISVTDCVFENNTVTYQKGGGIFIRLSSGTNTIDGCTFTSNYANSGGGGLWVARADVSISESVFYDNTTNGGGNPLYSGGGAIGIVADGVSLSASIISCDINGNYALQTNNPTGNGGGIFAFANRGGILDLVIEKSNIEGNYADNNGGGIYMNGLEGNVNIEDNNSTYNGSIQGNTAVAYGGGIYMYNLPYQPVINANEIVSNIAVNGAGIYCDTSVPVIIFNDIGLSGYPNIASNSGGGIYFKKTTGTLMYVIVIHGNKINNNEAAYGGGIYCDSSDIIIANPHYPHEISNNKATVSGGGIFVAQQSSPVLANIVFEENEADYGAGLYIEQNASPALTTNTISKNIATSNGGGIFIEQNATPSLTTNSFLENEAENGAGIYIDNTSFVLTGQTFEGNIASGNGGAVFTKQVGTNITLNIFNNNNQANKGGAIYCNTNSSPQISDNTIQQNSAVEGGGIYIESASPHIDNDIDYNSAYRGGGIFITGSSYPTFGQNHQILGNIASYGGGIYLDNANTNISGITIAQNQAYADGGGIYLESASPHIDNDFGNNSAFRGGGIYITGSSYPTFGQCNQILGNTASYGGGIYLENTNSNISGITIQQNHANSDGGGIYCDASNPHIMGNEIKNNTADGNGGGMYFTWTSGTAPANFELVSLNVFSGNEAENGGGLYVDAVPQNSIFRFVNNLVVTNTAIEDGGGIYLSEDVYDPPVINSNTIADNVASGANAGTEMHSGKRYYTPSFFNNIVWNSISNNVINSELSHTNSIVFNYCNIKGWGPTPIPNPSGNMDSDPRFHGNGNYRLQYNNLSPCIDRGTSAIGILRTSVDLDGNNRILLNEIDMGCYEHDGINWLIWMDENMTSMTKEKESKEETIEDKFSENSSMKIYPNPSNGVFYITLQLPQEQMITIKLYDLNGKIVSQTEKQLKQGYNQLAFDNDDLSKGLYFCKIITENGEVFKEKILIK